ncbi:hypothetical protein K443DRAFT_12854 [Laccaria amethystina LaAM-08-1]|uniref:Uncharacterized protein n=1 Tax=Laccaria amethystina LaAM-08-1 TaxID=1095629 RepID=A0A0C9WX81_9AGAR|nr:hypothetical protein K443DRAFT_12854 [Laccaria amethystina LaAM-08-1]
MPTPSSGVRGPTSSAYTTTLPASTRSRVSLGTSPTSSDRNKAYEGSSER